MNRQEAIAELKRMASTIEWDYPLDAQIAIERAVEALQDPWVSVETSLPKVGQAVLATCGKFVGEASLKENGHWIRHHGFAWMTAFGKPVTHWMPLPAPKERP